MSLSPEQQALLSLLGVSPSAESFTLRPLVLRVDCHEPLDEARLRAAVDAVRRAHLVLSHGFAFDAEAAVWRQHRLASLPPLSWSSTDLPLGAQGPQDAALLRWLDGLGQAPMEAPPGHQTPWARVAVAHHGSARATWVLALSPLVADGGSMMALFEQIKANYAHPHGTQPLSAGAAAQTDTFQYEQYVAWRMALAVDEDADAGRAHWSAYQRQWPALTPPRLHGCLPEVAGRHGATSPPDCLRHEGEIDAALAARLMSLGRALGTTGERILQAAWWLLLARLTDFAPFAAGWRHDCRRQYEVMQGGVGVFDKTLPLAIDARADEPFTEWLARLDRVAEAHLEAQEYLALDAPEWTAHATVGFEAVDALTASPSGPAWHVHARPLTPARFALHLQVALGDAAGAGRGEVVLHADAARHTPQAVARLWAQFMALLPRIVAQPQARLNELVVPGPQEQAALQALHTEPMDVGPDDVLAHILAWATRTPQAPALEAQGQRLTYGQLAERVERVALGLRAKGVSAGDLVGLNMPRSAELVIAMLGTWRAGAGYLPLAPDWPEDRRRAVLADARPVRVLQIDEPDREDGTDSETEGDSAPRAMSLAAVLSHATEVDAACLVDTGRPLDRIAYVLYTSGSTGTPKGVVIEHGALLNYVATASTAMKLGESRRWAMTSTVAADLGNTALLGALFNGACLVVAAPHETEDAQAFSRFIASQDIDGLKIVPSHLEALLECDLPRLPRKLILGGEVASPALLQRIARVAPHCVVHNHYGPTEASVGVLVHQVDPRDPLRAEGLPLSRVLANNQVLLLDEAMRPVPGGVLGQLYIGGAQLCRGYLNREVAGAFVADPFQPGARLYRTGDLAHVRAEGGLQLAGRADQQLKVRGFRVEPAEIESAIVSQPGIRQVSVVQVRDQSLVAFIVADADEATRRDALQAHLVSHLPSHMVPARLVFLPAFPRLGNGKIDRLALEAMLAEAPPDGPRTPPRNEVEAVLAQCMAELLGRDAVGVEDDFFELGGHSLLAIKLAARVRRLLQVEMPPGLVFDHPTVAELAQALQAQRESTPEAEHSR